MPKSHYLIIQLLNDYYLYNGNKFKVYNIGEKASVAKIFPMNIKLIFL